ncbi:Tubulin binding cofactor C family protein [Acanthocheilonema viteae]
MESKISTDNLESADLVSEKRQRMLARLEARHTRDTVGMKTSSTDAADFDKLLAKATRVMNSSELNIEPEFLQELETALTLIQPGRQSRRLKEALNVLRSQMQEQIGLAHQQSAFSFSTKKEGAAESKQKISISKYSPLGPIQTKIKPLVQKAVTITAEHEKELIAKGEDGEEVMISDVTSSLIRVPFNASTIHIKSVKHSTLIFAPVKTSLLIRDCEDLTVVVAAQQVRIHNSHHIRFYIEVRGALIIEDCDGIEVAPYNVVGLEHNPQNNNWRNVQDFSWLSSKEHSPNWKIMKENSARCFSL